jgi:mono/diheme cytochrome c family protein
VALGHPPIGHGQDITSILGNILRIDVDRGWPGYAIPQDNPFVRQQGVDEAYAWGWRNPWRMSFDRGGDNDLFVATNGQNLWEAVYRVTEPGNYGWNILEGTHCFDPQNPDETPPRDACPRVGPNGEPLHLPVIEYPHLENRGDAEVAGISVIGGYIYRGEALPDQQGNYIFGDWSQSFDRPAGQLLLATPSRQQGELWQVRQLMELESYVLGFGEDAAGEVYVLTTDNTGPTGTTGRVYRVVAAGEGDMAAAGDDGAAEAEEEPAAQEQAAEVEGDDGAEVGGAAAQAARDGWFTAAQAEEGRAEYQEYCQQCHGANLQGMGQFPALAGNRFVSRWFDRGVDELFEYTSTRMPLGNPGGLEQETYLAILAHILSVNEVPAGEEELTADPALLEQIPLGQ